MRWRLIDFRARCQDQFADAFAAAGVDHVDHALDTDIEHKFGGAVEKFRAVDEGEMMHLIDATHGARHHGGIADIAADEFDVAFDLPQAARRAARIVVQHPHGVAFFHQRLDERRTDEAAAAGDQYGIHACFSMDSVSTSSQQPLLWARRAVSSKV